MCFDFTGKTALSTYNWWMWLFPFWKSFLLCTLTPAWFFDSHFQSRQGQAALCVRLGTQEKNVCDRAPVGWVMFTLLVAGTSPWAGRGPPVRGTFLHYQGWVIGLEMSRVKGIPPDSGCSSQTPGNGTPRLQGQRPHGVKLSPGDPISLLLSIKEQFWSYFLDWYCSSVCPAFSFPGKPRDSLTLLFCFSNFTLFIYHSGFWGREICIPRL